jgi:hypothetical protein
MKTIDTCLNNPQISTATMKSRILPNGLSKRTNRCLTNAGLTIDKQSIIHALQAGKLYPSCWPPTYGKLTHREVCHWVGVDPESVPFTWADKWPPYIENGLSYRANNCLRDAGVLATKKAVTRALNNGDLLLRKRPSGYGKVTHAEICRWAGVDKSTSC